MPLALTDKITKLIPGTPGTTLDKALKGVPDLADLYAADPQVKQIIDIGKRLEGLCRNAGCHAAGVIIADQPLDGIVPLYKDKDDNILTQFEGPIAEKVGLLKMDFLGLRTLTVITRAVDLVKQTKGIDIDVEKLDLTDKTVLELFSRGETKGIFQFESGGMADLLMKMQPDRVEDLIAANALYRPGPMELIPSYARKHGREEVPKVHPIMDSILAETYGIMVYQEQVMQIFNGLGGIELSAAYKLIKAISKKMADVIGKFRPEFLKGCTAKGIPEAKADEIFEHILKFGGYGFNKSHSTRYAIVAFQTAYLKTYHPVEYMAALLTYEMGNTEKTVEYIEECRRMTLADGTKGIKVLPPDINISERDFTPVYVEPESKGSCKAKPPKEGVIRFGMAAVRWWAKGRRYADRRTEGQGAVRVALRRLRSRRSAGGDQVDAGSVDQVWRVQCDGQTGGAASGDGCSGRIGAAFAGRQTVGTNEHVRRGRDVVRRRVAASVAA